MDSKGGNRMNEPVQMTLDLYTGITEQSEDTPVSDNIISLSIALQITYDFKGLFSAP